MLETFEYNYPVEFECYVTFQIASYMSKPKHILFLTWKDIRHPFAG